MTWGEGDPSISVYTGCSVWGYSAYANINPYEPNVPLPCSWSISGSGTVTAGGSIDDDSLGANGSASSSASASGGIDAIQSGSGYAGGYVSAGSNGSAYVSIGDYTTEDSSTVNDDEDGWYYASLSFSVEGSDSYDAYGTQCSVSATVCADVSAGAGVSTNQGYSGEAGAGSDASFGGSASVSVSL